MRRNNLQTVHCVYDYVDKIVNVLFDYLVVNKLLDHIRLRNESLIAQLGIVCLIFRLRPRYRNILAYHSGVDYNAVNVLDKRIQHFLHVVDCFAHKVLLDVVVYDNRVVIFKLKRGKRFGCIQVGLGKNTFRLFYAHSQLFGIDS